jgi:hypothetical protein
VKLRNLYSSLDIVRVINSRRKIWAVHVALTGEMSNAYLLGGKPKGKKPLGNPRHRLEDDIKMCFKDIIYDNVDWIHVAQDRNQWRDRDETSGCIKGWEFLGQLSDC